VARRDGQSLLGKVNSSGIGALMSNSTFHRTAPSRCLVVAGERER